MTDIKKALATIEKKLPSYDVPEVIENAEGNKLALDLVAKVKKAKKLIEGRREFYAKPHYNEYKRIRELFKPFLDMLGEKEGEIKTKMLVFHSAEQKRLDKEQKKIEEEALKKAKDGEAIEVEEVNDIARTESIHGVSNIKKVKKWRVVDFEKIPREYLIVDEKLVKEALKKEN